MSDNWKQKHAYVPQEIEGKMVDIPIIGVEPSKTQEKCDRCGNTFHMSKLVLTQTEFVCPKCLRAEYAEFLRDPEQND